MTGISGQAVNDYHPLSLPPFYIPLSLNPVSHGCRQRAAGGGAGKAGAPHIFARERVARKQLWSNGGRCRRRQDRANCGGRGEPE